MTASITEAESRSRKRAGRGIQGDVDGLSCDASLGIILRGDVRDIQAGLTDMEPVLGRHGLKLVYKLLYPGRLRIKREPIIEPDAVTEGGDRGLD